MRRLAWVWSLVVLGYLLAPIVVMAAFGFNAPKGRFNVVWQGFTWDGWRHPFAIPALVEALWLSLRVAAVSTLVATVLGTALALGLVRTRFRGRGGANLLVVLPIAAPDIVIGAALLSLFLAAGTGTGIVTIVAAHVMFGLGYVTVTVKARLRGFDWSLVEAAHDLGAGEWRTLRRVTLPLIAPGVMSAALLCFALSLDDFTITLFVSGSRVTFPLYVWGAARVAVPPQINVLGTAMLLITLALFGAGALLSGRGSRR